MKINTAWHSLHRISENASFAERAEWREEHERNCGCRANSESRGIQNSDFSKQNFKEKVYEMLRTVPKGKVVTYGQLARLAGSPKAARAVGMCMQQNPDAPKTPCHRVVASDGSLHGYSAGEGIITKKKMLIDEGVTFKGERVDLSVSRWDV